MPWKLPAIAVINLILAGCAGRSAKPVEDLGTGRDVSRFTLNSIRGTRDGDRMDVRAIYGDGTGEIRVELHIAVGAQSHLSSGSWTGFGNEGAVRERSLTFLGGQSGPPSLGGRFDLVGPGNAAQYRVTIPLQPLNQRL